MFSRASAKAQNANGRAGTGTDEPEQCDTRISKPHLTRLQAKGHTQSDMPSDCICACAAACPSTSLAQCSMMCYQGMTEFCSSANLHSAVCSITLLSEQMKSHKESMGMDSLRMGHCSPATVLFIDVRRETT